MRIVPRSEWGHPGPLGPATVTTPASTLWLHHSVTAHDDGWDEWRTIAQIGVNRFGRSSYSYVLSPGGSIGEMQGKWIGAHTAGHNSTTLAVVLPGNYEHDEITDAQIEGVAWLHGELVRLGLLAADAPIRAHRDAPGASTACPGDNAVAALPAIRARLGQASPPPSTPPSGGTADVELPTLSQRTHGDRHHGSVLSLQALLVEKAGQEIAMDGWYGDRTEAAVINVQRFFSLTVDGWVGPETWPALFL